MNMNYVFFEGNENETEFLEKCLKQWEISQDEQEPFRAMMQLGSVFREMRHRKSELEQEEEKEVLMFNGEIFLKPSSEFQKQWGIKRLELELSEDGEIKTESVTRYPSAACVHWSEEEE